MEEKICNNFENLPICLSVDEVGQILNLNKTAIYALTRRKDFPSFRVRRRIVIPKDALREWLLKMAKEGDIIV